MDRWTDEYSNKDDNNVVIRIIIMILFQPTEVFVNVMEGEGWGPKTPSENKTSVKVTSQRWWWWWWWWQGDFSKMMMKMTFVNFWYATALSRYDKKCVNSRQNSQNRPKGCLLYTKKVRRLEKSTLLPVVACWLISAMLNGGYIH